MGIGPGASEPRHPLQIHDYRLFWVARFAGVIATLSMVVVLGWQVYDIARSDYGMSRSLAAFQLGLLGAAQFVPLFLLTTLALAVFLPRSSGLVAGLAAVPIGIQLKQWLRQLRHLGRPGKQAIAVAGMVASLLPALPLTLMMHAAPSHAATDRGATLADGDRCDVRDVLPALGAEAANVLAPIDLGPAILLDSPHKVVATAHHRAHKGIADTIRAFGGTQDAAHSILRKRQIGFVMMCPKLAEVRFYRSRGENNFADRLAEGDAPDWLMPISHKGDPGVLVWRVIG